MTAATAHARHELIGLYGVVEPDWFTGQAVRALEVAFFLWTIANTLSIVLHLEVRLRLETPGNDADLFLGLIGAVVLACLRDHLRRDPRRERSAWSAGKGQSSTRSWPRSRWAHLIGMGIFSVFYGRRARVAFGSARSRRCSLSNMPEANSGPRSSCSRSRRSRSSASGWMTAVTPLISPRRAPARASMTQGVMLGAFRRVRQVDKLPDWMRRRSRRSRRRPTRCRDRQGIMTATASPKVRRRHLAAAHDRRGCDPARALRVPPRRDVRQEARLRLSGSSPITSRSSTANGDGSRFRSARSRPGSST